MVFNNIKSISQYIIPSSNFCKAISPSILFFLHNVESWKPSLVIMTSKGSHIEARHDKSTDKEEVKIFVLDLKYDFKS